MQGRLSEMFWIGLVFCISEWIMITLAVFRAVELGIERPCPWLLLLRSLLILCELGSGVKG